MSRSHASRCADHRAASTALTALDDRQLSALVQAATAVATFSGTAVRLEIAGVPVFAKRVPLTPLEHANPMSTANLFDLPLFYQYRLGSSGFGVWREVVAHELTTAWVLEDRCAGFPLAYHWRVLDSGPRTASVDLERMAVFWRSPAVRERLGAISSSTLEVVLFLEYIPHTLHAWLTAQLAFGDDRVRAACAMVEREARSVVAAMRSNGFVHFDPHFHNLLTDGERLYFADLGLASSRRFTLAPAELDFFAHHSSYDGCVIANDLVRWIDSAYTDTSIPAFAAAIRDRLAPVAAIMTAFYARLREDRTTPFPVDEIGAVCDPDRLP